MSGDSYVLHGFAVPEGVEALHDLLEQVGSEHPEVDSSDLMLFETAVIEIANNVVEHGRPLGKVQWRFSLDVLPGQLEAVLSDSGEAYPGDIDYVMPDELAESGRGLPLARAILDEIDYTRAGDANHWHLVRRRAASS
ncbi:ATP-binding protein [Nocardioides humilatus]|uniref:ATP-binding protein n=1 Tax=Nocardioides humilatus TaxID=2607660 RepID=A0A5B1L9E0_9ACTN|nr:ATP-binding protein [Nocardioides humilatus]KAA1416838.1 ATP-binding protein [Nocardioides humilatus]